MKISSKPISSVQAKIVVSVDDFDVVAKKADNDLAKYIRGELRI